MHLLSASGAGALQPAALKITNGLVNLVVRVHDDMNRLRT